MRRRAPGALLVLAALSLGACTSERDDESEPTPEELPEDSRPGPLLEILPPVAVDRCADVPTAEPSIIGAGGTDLPDPVFLWAVNSYIAEHDDVFGGRWLDPDAGGTYVVAFTDDPRPHRAELAARLPSTDDFVGYWPPPQITDHRPIGEWDVAWDVVQVEHTELDLVRAITDVRAAVDEAGLETSAIRVDVARSRLAIELTDPADDVLERLARVVDLRRVCVDTPAGASPAPPR